MTTTTSLDLVRLFANAVANSKASALRIGHDNLPARDPSGQEEWLPLRDAIDSGEAFAVTPREGLLALDVDFKEQGVPPVWLKVAKQECRDVGCYTVEVTSGSATGNRHLWVSTPVGWTSQEFGDRLKAAGVPASQLRLNQRTRPPLSPHRLGGHGDLLEPQSWEEAITLLTVRPHQTTPSQQLLHRLRAGDPAVGRDALAMAVAVSYVNADWGVHRYVNDMLSPVNAGGRKVQELPQDRRWPYLSRKYEDARRFVRQNPATDGRLLREAKVKQLQLSLQQVRFTGHERTDRLAFTYLVSLATLLTNTEVNCSVRQLAKAIGVSTNATHRALQRLQKRHHLLEQLEEGAAGKATRWRVLPRATEGMDINYLPWGAEKLDVHPSVAFSERDGLHPAFSGCGLPSDAGLLWNAMASEHGWYRVRDLRSLMPGLSQATIRKHLHALHSAGLVEPRSLRSWDWQKRDCLPAYLDELAERFGSARQRRRQERKLNRQRDSYNLQESHRTPGRPCAATTSANAPCRSLAMQVGPEQRSEHCWAHAVEADRLAGTEFMTGPLHPSFGLAT